MAARTTPFVIDYEHQTLRAVNNGKARPAAGCSARWNGVKARACMPPVWSGRYNAAAMIAAGEYKFISPVFAYNKRGEVLELLHAALTNTPALDGMDAVMLAAASRLASLSTETETTTVDEELFKRFCCPVCAGCLTSRLPQRRKILKRAAKVVT
ncbi:phage protease [Escherichia coli]|uniref:phage protease n=1 Tax=Escherichia coli TaxID=562 RepID=UPI002FCD03A9